MTKRAPAILLIALVAIVVALLWVQFPGEIGMIERLSRVALLIETQTHWSFPAVSNLVLLIFMLALLLAQQILVYLTKLFMWIIEAALRAMAGQEFRQETLVSERLPWKWFGILVLTWLLSIAVIRIMQLGPHGLVT